jgi:hypothetical protein
LDLSFFPGDILRPELLNWKTRVDARREFLRDHCTGGTLMQDESQEFPDRMRAGSKRKGRGSLCDRYFWFGDTAAIKK